MKRQERFLSQRDLAVVRVHVTVQKPGQASIDMPLHSETFYLIESDTDTLKTKGIDKLVRIRLLRLRSFL